MVYGWAGTILRLDLTKKKVSKTPSAEYTVRFLGARGINGILMYEESKPGQNAYDMENPIIIGAGALSATGALSCAKMEITTRSPEQEPQGFGNVGFGGSWGPELKLAGYDNVVIKGRAKKPTYIYIDNEDVKFNDASGIWGKGIFEVNRIIREELGDPLVKVLCIGPAGEKLVRSATIEHEYRSGTALGAVMGSKNLKAVVVRGTKGVKVYDPVKMLELIAEHLEKLKEHDPKVRLGGGFGMSAVEWWFDQADIGVVGYYEGFEWHDLDKTRGKPFLQKYGYKMMGCYDCPVSCMPIMRIPGIGTSMMRCYPFWWVWMLWLTDMEKAFEATMLCSNYGLENRELACVTAWLMRMYQDGIITAKDTDGIPMERGNGDALIQLIHKVANREGFGDILAEGPLKFARKLGPKAESYLVHRHGLLPRTVDFRVSLGKALGLAVASRGSSHRNQVWREVWEKAMKAEEIEACYAYAKKEYGTEKAVIPWEYEGKAKLLVEEEHEHAIFDVLGLCAAAAVPESETMKIVPPSLELWASTLSAATGLRVDEKGLFLFAERVLNIERAWQAREGWTRKEDTLPEFFFKEPVPNGPSKGRGPIDRAKFEKMKSEYYELRGWDVETGIPTRNTLERLGMKDIADSLDKLGRLPKAKKPNRPMA